MDEKIRKEDTCENCELYEKYIKEVFENEQSSTKHKLEIRELKTQLSDIKTRLFVFVKEIN